MDLLSQYKQDRPEALRPTPQWEPPKEFGFFIRLVMRLSGGRIREVNRASYVLLGIAIITVIVSAVLYFQSGTPGPSGRIIPVAGPNAR